MHNQVVPQSSRGGVLCKDSMRISWRSRSGACFALSSCWMTAKKQHENEKSKKLGCRQEKIALNIPDAQEDLRA